MPCRRHLLVGLCFRHLKAHENGDNKDQLKLDTCKVCWLNKSPEVEVLIFKKTRIAAYWQRALGENRPLITDSAEIEPSNPHDGHKNEGRKRLSRTSKHARRQMTIIFEVMVKLTVNLSKEWSLCPGLKLNIIRFEWRKS